MTLGQYLDREVDLKSLAHWATFEFLAELVGHFHVFKHDFKALSKLAAALFLEFEHERSLSLFADLTLFKQALGETADIEALEDIFVEKVSENMNDFVQSFC